jgi:hypothetical protein
MIQSAHSTKLGLRDVVKVAEADVDMETIVADAVEVEVEVDVVAKDVAAKDAADDSLRRIKLASPIPEPKIIGLRNGVDIANIGPGLTKPTRLLIVPTRLLRMLLVLNPMLLCSCSNY